MARSATVRKPQTTAPAAASAKAPEKTAGKLESVQGQRALQLDRLIHERARLAIVSALAASKSLTFSELKRLLDVTDGNLSIHCRKLEEADYIACEKTFDKRVPKTTYRLTEAGRRALERYLSHMEALIRAARER